MSEILHATQNWTNEQLKLIESYGTTDVYVLQEGVDFVINSGLVISAGQVLDYHDKVVVMPEIDTSYQIDGTEVWLKAKELIVSSTFFGITGNCVEADKLTIPEGVTQVFITDLNPSSDLYLPSTIINLDLYTYSDGTIYFSENTGTVVIGYIYGTDVTMYCPVTMQGLHFDYGQPDVIYAKNPNMDIGGVLNKQLTLYGYAGSTAEDFSKDEHYGSFINFINIGSDYSININNSTATEATLSPNEYYTFVGADETPLSSLTVTLDTASTTKLDEFMFSFETPSDISAFSFGVLTDESIEIKWVKEPNLKPDYVYEVSVVNGVGVIAGTAKEVTE